MDKGSSKAKATSVVTFRATGGPNELANQSMVLRVNEVLLFE
jgi:hypothetical protein